MDTVLQYLATVHANVVLSTTSKHSVGSSMYDTVTVLGGNNSHNLIDVLLRLKILNGENYCCMYYIVSAYAKFC